MIRGTKAKNNLSEKFPPYDIQNRLTTISGPSPMSISYNPDGTIEEKSDAGSYSTYASQHPDGVEEIAGLTNSVISHETQNIIYNAFNKVYSIQEGLPPDQYELSITYGPGQQRMKSEMTYQGNNVYTKYFANNFEKLIINGHTYEINYIQSPTGLCAINVKKDNDVRKMYYVYSDHLGSILTLTDDQGAIVLEQNFDAWGRKRNPTDWTYTNIPVPSGDMEWLYRGYTGHEHLPEFSLINMNGRMYDPVVGVMLSPDNYVQEISSTKNFNRYSYCVNNPLNSTDPSGDFIFTLLAAVFCPPLIPLGVAMDVGGVANTVAHIEKIDKPGDFFAAYGIGAAAGAAAYYTGGAAFTWAGGTALGGGGFMAGGIAAGTGAVSSTAILSTGNGVYFQDPINPGDISITLATSIVLGGTLQGLNAVSHDRSFWSGKFGDLASMPTINANSVPQKQHELQLKGQTGNLSEQIVEQPTLNKVYNSDGNLEYTIHGKNRLLQRGFSDNDVQKIINEGQKINIIGPNGTPQIMYKLSDYKVIIETTGRNAGKIVTIEGNNNIIRFSDGLKGIFTGW